MLDSRDKSYVSNMNNILSEILKDISFEKDNIDNIDNIKNLENLENKGKYKLLKIVLSNPRKNIIINRNKSDKEKLQNDNFNLEKCINKIIIEVIDDIIHISKYTKKQVFNTNMNYTYSNILEFFKENDYEFLNFKQINVFLKINVDFSAKNKCKECEKNAISLEFFEKIILTSKKLKISSKIKKVSDNNTILKLKKLDTKNTQNNIKKHLLKDENENIYNIPALIDIGVVNSHYQIVNSMYSKFKQIDRFLTIIDYSIKNILKKREKSNKKDQVIHIIDFGCGKSYLTFVIYHYLKEIRKINVKITGLDLKEDVIINCNNIAKKYNYEDLKFEVGDIAGIKTKEKVDVVISLHACNTATDFSIINGVRLGADAILSIPCCHHELNENISNKDLKIISRYGLIKERISALLTDAIRANALIYNGYSVKMLEFVDFEHTPKNILIKAEKANISKKDKEKALEEILALEKEIGYKTQIFEILNLK